MKVGLSLIASAMIGVAGYGTISSAAIIDNFDSYADQTALNAVWTAGSGAGGSVALDTDGTPTPVSSPNTVSQNTTAQQMYRNDATGIQLRDIDFSFSYYDESTALGRTYAMIYSRGTTPNAAWTDSLNQILAIGDYNGITGTKYAARIAFGSVNWTSLDAVTSPDRSVGWHTMRIAGDGAVAPTITFYVDGLVGKAVALTQPQGDVLANYVVIGSNLTSTHAANFDNVSLQAIPEPASLGLLSLAGLGLLRRRRA